MAIRSRQALNLVTERGQGPEFSVFRKTSVMSDKSEAGQCFLLLLSSSFFLLITTTQERTVIYFVLVTFFQKKIDISDVFAHLLLKINKNPYFLVYFPLLLRRAFGPGSLDQLRYLEYVP